MNKIYIVEDDSVIAGSIKTHLITWDMDVKVVENFQGIVNEVREYEPDLVLMDIKLPFYNGFYWCGEIRKFSKVPIIFLSSADDNMNIVMAINMGGDDFISKPFDLNVLTAKIQAMLRRAYGMEMKSNILSCCGVELNLDDTSAVFNQEKIELTKNEFLILKILFENKNRVVSREDIMERLWGDDEFVDDNTLTVNVTRIRKKFAAVGLSDLISTKRGLGYIVEE
ncbi:MAG: response regulator transcription factor [Agathobacter sp.]|nr:response regulator transcription factor [Agathobacter sp.]